MADFTLDDDQKQAAQAVIEMLMEIEKDRGNYQKAIERAKDRNDPFRLMGFGHRVYKTYDPRAKIMKKICDNLLKSLNIDDPLLDIAKELEAIAPKDPYFIDHNLYPNVDFYSGSLYNSMGIPADMFTPVFAISRIAGWCAHVIEEQFAGAAPKPTLYRPESEYIGDYCGPDVCEYAPIEDR